MRDDHPPLPSRMTVGLISYATVSSLSVPIPPEIMITASAARTVSVFRIHPIPVVIATSTKSLASRLSNPGRIPITSPPACFAPRLTASRHACDTDLLYVTERPRTWRVQRPKAAEPAREISLVRVAPSESDRLPPEGIARGAEPPPRREDRGEIVRIVIVARALASRAGHGVRESPFDREVFERRGADLLGRRMLERTEDMPEQHVAREVIRLPQGVVRRRLGGRHQAEGRPTLQQPVQRRAARVAVALAHDAL